MNTARQMLITALLAALLSAAPAGAQICSDLFAAGRSQGPGVSAKQEFIAIAHELEGEEASLNKRSKKELLEVFRPYLKGAKRRATARFEDYDELRNVVRQVLAERQEKIPGSVLNQVKQIERGRQKQLLGIHQKHLDAIARYLDAKGVKFEWHDFSNGRHSRKVITLQGGLGRLSADLRLRDKLTEAKVFTSVIDPYANLLSSAGAFAIEGHSFYGASTFIALIESGRAEMLAHEHIHNLHYLRGLKDINPHSVRINDPAGSLVGGSLLYGKYFSLEERIAYASDGRLLLRQVMNEVFAPTAWSAEKATELLEAARYKITDAMNFSKAAKRWIGKAIDENWQLTELKSAKLEAEKPTILDDETEHRSPWFPGKNLPRGQRHEVVVSSDVNNPDAPYIELPLPKKLRLSRKGTEAAIRDALLYLRKNNEQHVRMGGNNLRLLNGVEEFVKRLVDTSAQLPAEFEQLRAELREIPTARRAKFLKSLSACESGCEVDTIRRLIEQARK